MVRAYQPAGRFNWHKRQTTKLRLTLLWGGQDFRQFAQNAGVVHTGEGADTLENAIDKVREACRKHVNLSMAMYKLMHAKQGTKSVTEFARELDQLGARRQFDTNPYTKEQAKKRYINFWPTSDEKLRQGALKPVAQYTLQTKCDS